MSLPTFFNHSGVYGCKNVWFSLVITADRFPFAWYIILIATFHGHCCDIETLIVSGLTSDRLNLQR